MDDIKPTEPAVDVVDWVADASVVLLADFDGEVRADERSGELKDHHSIRAINLFARSQKHI